MAVKDHFLRRIVFFVSGLLLIAFGISTTIIADFGCGGWDATNIGLVKHFSLSVGTWLNIWAIIFLCLAKFFSKERFRPECLITSFIIGLGVDMFNYILSPITITTSWIKPLCFIVGTIIICIGAGLYLVSELPPNPVDYMMMAMKDYFHISITLSKTIVEATGIILGLLLGGPIGVGTFVMIIIFGPCMDFCYGIAKKIFTYEQA